MNPARCSTSEASLIIISDSKLKDYERTGKNDLKRKLREGLAELKLTFDELHKTLEWAELTECYPEASAVYRRIEYLEDIVNKI